MTTAAAAAAAAAAARESRQKAEQQEGRRRRRPLSLRARALCAASVCVNVQPITCESACDKCKSKGRQTMAIFERGPSWAGPKSYRGCVWCWIKKRARVRVCVGGRWKGGAGEWHASIQVMGGEGGVVLVLRGGGDRGKGEGGERGVKRGGALPRRAHHHDCVLRGQKRRGTCKTHTYTRTRQTPTAAAHAKAPTAGPRSRGRKISKYGAAWRACAHLSGGGAAAGALSVCVCVRLPGAQPVLCGPGDAPNHSTRQ